jgi:signal transduction histidine kinase
VWRAFSETPDDRIQITVTDDGRGMTEADRAKPAGKIEVNLL